MHAIWRRAETSVRAWCAASLCKGTLASQGGQPCLLYLQVAGVVQPGHAEGDHALRLNDLRMANNTEQTCS